MDLNKVKEAFKLATVFFKTLLKLFEALEVGTDDEGKATYYEYLNIVHDGAEEVLNSDELADLTK